MERLVFGYVAANPKFMTEQEQQRYRGAYCGLCRVLGKRHGQLSRLSLTFDMTFLAMFLGAMYVPEEVSESFRCVVHPKGTHNAVTTVYTEYAADMNVLLAYLNCMDNWRDDRSIAALGESVLFRKGYQQACGRYPRQAQVIQEELEKLSQMEQARCEDPDAAANCFGRMLGELFVPHAEDYFARELREFGFYLGKFIYLYDACMDWEADRKKGSYNPVLLRFGAPIGRETMQTALVPYISRCLEIFERLPIVQDGTIIRNILYSGVWQAFREKYGTDGNGSIEQ